MSVTEDGGLPGEDLTSDGGLAPPEGGWKLSFTFRAPPPLAALAKNILLRRIIEKYF